jgi:cobyrinic acid a,c-diamide synthase
MANDAAIRRAHVPGTGLIIAGPASGAGKTTVTLALMAALRKRGLAVQPFKCGPDFIDGGHHGRVCGRASRNLDGWMLGAEVNREIFGRGATGADVCVVEGMMGLFDGVDGKSEAGSTAEMAKWLGLPVILVVDAGSMARSAAALVHGFESFDPALKVAGVIFNKVAGDAHYQFLKDALAKSTRALPLGYLPSDTRIRIPERYLGLFTAGENLLPESAFSLLGELAESSVDVHQLLECAAPIAGAAEGFPTENFRRGRGLAGSIRLGVARDKAFCFYYEDNLDALREAGAEIVEFSPLADASLPADLDGLYFGGGYPELFAKELTENRGMLASIGSAAEAGLPIYAECGGLMYLAREIVTKEGAAFAMAGVLPLGVQMTERLVNFGYTEVSLTADCLLGQAGGKARGHSFHCSRIIDCGPIAYAYRTKNSMTGREEREGMVVKNVLASYMHLHFLSSPGMAGVFVENVRKARRGGDLIAAGKRHGAAHSSFAENER